MLAEDLGATLAHHFATGLYAKETRIPAGMVLVQHRHIDDHLSILASGTVELEVDGQRSAHTGPACLTIRGGQHHGVKALTDVVWFCIHATDCDDPEQVDQVLIAADSSDTQMRSIAEALA
jgi:quercetin dioxygenase-like cupin family protein